MRSKWKDWDYLNSWIFGTVAVSNLVHAIMFIFDGEYAKGFCILAVSLYAGTAAWLSYRIWDDRFVERFMEKYTVARLPCGASIELVEVRSIYDPSFPGRYKKAESPSTVLKVVGCRDVAYHGRHGCPRLRALSNFFVAERNASPAAGSDAGGVDENGIPPVIYGFNGGERHCLPLNGIDFCFYPDAYTVPTPVPDRVEHGKKEARNSQAEAIQSNADFFISPQFYHTKERTEMRKTKKKFDPFEDGRADITPAPAKATARQSAKPSDKETARQLMEQYRVVVAAERASFRERVKFGAMLILWEQYLGESRGGATNGQRGTSGGEGLKGWLEQNCPAISYVSAMAYKDAAKRAVSMLGGGAMATAALLGESEVTQPSGETVEVSAQIIEKRDAIFEDATSRRKLEQMYFDFMGKEEKAAMRKARKEKDGVSAHKEVAKAKLAAANGKVLSAADSAAILWGDAMAVFETNRGAFFSAARDLNVNLAEGWLEELKMLVDALKKRVAQR